MSGLRLVVNEGRPAEPFSVHVGAALIADVLESTAARMQPVDDPIRALALRSATRWRTMTGARPVRLSGLDSWPPRNLGEVVVLRRLHIAAVEAVSQLPAEGPWSLTIGQLADQLGADLRERT